jgi:hypothetical protein
MCAPAGLKFHRLGKHFLEPSDHDKIPLCKVLYFVGGTAGLMAEWNRRERTKDQKMVVVQGSFYAPPTHIHSSIRYVLHNLGHEFNWNPLSR